MRVTEPTIGAAVALRQRKWDGSSHRRASMLYLGSDKFGGWLANADGSPFPVDSEARDPARVSVRRGTHVMLVPHAGCYLAHFNAPPHRTAVYADITTAPEFCADGSGWSIAAVDLELDVVRSADGQAWIEDEDEFAAHTVRYGYPPEIVARTRVAADEVLAAALHGTEPFGAIWRSWVSRAAAILCV